MADHSKPTITSNYVNYTDEIKGRIDDVLKGLDPATTSPTNIPTNAIRWNSASAKWEKWNGTAWADLISTYDIKTLKTVNIVGGNSTTLLGAIPYQSNTDTTTLLVPNTTTTRKFLRQLGTGTNGGLPVWDTLQAGDIPSLNYVAKITSVDNQLVRFNGTTGEIQGSGVVVDDNVNMGLGVTPSAWGSSYKALEVGTSVGLYDIGSGDRSGLSSNAYYNGTNWIYRGSQNATRAEQYDGSFNWYTAPSGTAGNPITWNQILSIPATGGLTLGGTTPDLLLDTLDGADNKRIRIFAGGIASASRGAGIVAYGNEYVGAEGDLTLNSGNNGGTNTDKIQFVTRGTVKAALTGNGDFSVVGQMTTGGISVGNVANAGATVLDWYEEATATLTATGMTTSPTGTATLTRIGNTVTMEIPTISGTSNATTFTLTGIPVAFRPSASRSAIVPVVDNGTATALSLGEIATTGTITLYKTYDGGAFTASGTKSVKRITISYHI